MIQIIHGRKGSGKTKRIIDMANQSLKDHDGSIVFIDDDNRYMFDLKHEIRFINATEYHISSPDMFLGFIGGVLASNYDLSLLFVDGFLRILNAPLSQLEDFFINLEEYTLARNITLVLSVSAGSDEMPGFLKKFII